MFASTLRNEHGWEVALRCTNCGYEGKPAFQGWTPTREVNFGDTPTIFANITCPQCAANLRNSAGLKLPELFAGIQTPQSNKLAILYFVAALLVYGVGILWLRRAFPGSSWVTGVQLGILFPLIYGFTWFVHRARYRCPCGNAHYLLMGLLGRSYCYRCSTCGNLLRLRD